ncbi:hypothetical protein FQR65_LT09643 [Abscondita terminalis]|nr:hypothetical protein FQR65_LT09643 [Abscondita terminalis]
MAIVLVYYLWKKLALWRSRSSMVTKIFKVASLSAITKKSFDRLPYLKILYHARHTRPNAVVPSEGFLDQSALTPMLPVALSTPVLEATQANTTSPVLNPEVVLELYVN